LLRAFFDVERAEACAFFEGGKWHVGPGPSYYCLPLAMARHDVDVGPYSDKRCQERVALSPSSGPAAYAIVQPVDACAVAPQVHRAGAPVTGVPWVFDGVRCVRASVALTTQPLGELVPLESFARADEHVENRESRIASLVAVAPDGAGQTIGGFDQVRGELVRTEEPRDGGAFRWVPSRVAFQGAGEVRFADGSCSSPVATKLTRDAICPLSAALVFTDECGTTAYRELGRPLDPSRLYEQAEQQNACVAASGPNVLAFEPGAPIPPSALADAYVYEVGGDVVRRRGFAGPGGAVALWGDVIDATTNEPCAPATAADGALRCLPTASATLDLFADEACETPAFAEPSGSCARQASARFVRVDGKGGARVFEVTGTAPSLYRTKGEACLRFAPVVQSLGFALREVDVTRFALVAERELEASSP
jgi:hypothetical protein